MRIEVKATIILTTIETEIPRPELHRDVVLAAEQHINANAGMMVMEDGRKVGIRVHVG